MHCFTQKCICVFLVTFQLTYSLSIGDICTDHRTGETGFCKLITKCSSAASNIPKGIFPLTCGFDGLLPIICCHSDKENNATVDDHAPTTPRVTTVPPTNGDKSKISLEKCKDYGKYVYSTELSPILLPGIHKVTIDTCGSNNGIYVISNVASPREFPHMALIGYKSSNGKVWQCGGTLLNEQYILTSARCTDSKTHGYARYVKLGDLDLSDNQDIAEPQDIDILEIIRHPDFNESSLYNDIALIKLVVPVTLNTFVRPACLPSEGTPKFNKFLASGWGTLSPDGYMNSKMQKSIMNVLTNTRCLNELKTNRKYKIDVLNEAIFCAEPSELDACLADRGGPAQIYRPEVYCSYTVVGVTSFWRRCGIDNTPGIYTRVSKYIDWIEHNIWS